MIVTSFSPFCSGRACYQRHEAPSWQIQKLRFTHGHNPKASVERDIVEYQRLRDPVRERTDTRENHQQSQSESVARYDKKRRAPAFQAGDLVLLKLGARGALDVGYEGRFESLRSLKPVGCCLFCREMNRTLQDKTPCYAIPPHEALQMKLRAPRSCPLGLCENGECAPTGKYELCESMASYDKN
ncbi:hypothetical protein MTO96_032151 [Rhipicephalus appendiculatus]